MNTCLYAYIKTETFMYVTRVVFSFTGIILGILKMISFPIKSLGNMPVFLLSKSHFFLFQIFHVLKTSALKQQQQPIEIPLIV